MSVAENSAPKDSPEDALFVTDDPGVLNSIFLGDNKTVHVLFSALAASGCGASKGAVTVTRAEMDIRYSSQ